MKIFLKSLGSALVIGALTYIFMSIAAWFGIVQEYASFTVVRQMFFCFLYGLGVVSVLWISVFISMKVFCLIKSIEI